MVLGTLTARRSATETKRSSRPTSRAFDAIGGIPTKHIKLDSLTSAVTKVIYGPGRASDENDRSVLARSAKASGRRFMRASQRLERCSPPPSVSSWREVPKGPC